MADNCCTKACAGNAPVDPRYRRALWIALWINAAMFAIEIIAGIRADSVSLLADAVDFFGDAANYGLSLFALALAPIWRPRSALIKGLTMGGYGVFVLGKAGWNALSGTVPEPLSMAVIAILALLANVTVATLLFVFRNGDADMRSVWLCSRNDAIGNIAVLLAAAGVFGTASGWPDLIVAVLMGTLALTASRAVLIQARQELRAA